MMHDFTRHESSQTLDDEAQLQHWLRDAFDAPPVPRSLLKRLDRAVAQEWGRTSVLVDRRPRRAAWRKAAAIAVSAALVLVMVLLVGPGTPAYGWSAMVDALERQGVVEIDGPTATRWLALGESVLSERSDGVTYLVDLQQDVVYEHGDQESRIRRRRLPPEIGERDRLVLAFLLGNVRSGDSVQRFRGAKKVAESWKRVRQADRDEIRLHVRFDTDNAERFAITLNLDPATRLPLTCEVEGRHIPQPAVKLVYPGASASDLRSREFPPEIPVVDAIENGVPLADNSPAIPLAKPQNTAGLPATSTAGKPAVPPAEANPDTGVAAAPPFVGAASSWKPVQVTNRSRADVLRAIDAALEDLWRKQNVDSAPSATDEELLRRAYLDLAGRTPSVNEVRTYLSNKSPGRYEQLIDRLLQSPDHASHMATVWRTFLIPEGVDLTAFGGVEAFDRWLAERFGDGDPYDEIVRKLLLAEGRLSRSGPLLFYSAAKLDPDQLASRTARVFLGMRLECAQCHNHPFEPWTQQDFWSFAAFFAQISRPQGELQAVSTVMQVRDIERGEVKLPDTDTIVSPRFLNGGVGAADDTGEARRRRLALWLTSAENPYFARAAANRVWGLLFGKGIVDPIDDFGVRHPPKSPEVLEILASHFLHSRFDLRELVRTVALTRAYRLSSGAATEDDRRAEWFAQMHVKTLTAEQVYDCVTVAAMLDTKTAADPFAMNITRFGNA
ncbi:MAG TPA: DUF1549 domain-containing protein, partial [Planctomycetaceae bacterium]|nr:DUF1549 domain-containing protein [Planctomycetaceae bacterium]